MSDLIVRAYNVGFGDAVLVSIPETGRGGTETVRHLLIDVGNVLTGKGGSDEVFNPVVTDIAQRTGGNVDLYVMTHEHLDHVQGLLFAANAQIALSASYAWLTGSAAPGYYEDPRHKGAHKQLSDDQAKLRDLTAQAHNAPDAWLDMMIRNNAPFLSKGGFGLRTADYVDHLRGVARPARTHYISRADDLAGKHPFQEAQLKVLAPEENTADYARRRRPSPPLTSAAADPAGPSLLPSQTPAMMAPPVGVDAGAFFDLVRSRRTSGHQAILEIDKAANNTSIVLQINWRGWRLLFPGDAEERSWRMMRELDLLEPVHFVKIAHHGSVNGTDPEALDIVLPPTPPDRRRRRAVVSTQKNVWDSVPDKDTLDLYRGRCEVIDTRDVPPGTAVVITFGG